MNFELTRYNWALIILLVISVCLYYAGFFRFLQRVVIDCLIDHTTGRYTINNVARFTTHFVFLFLLIGVHFQPELKPAFKIKTVPFSEWEIGLLLAFIIGAEAVKKIKNPTNNI